VHASFFVNIEDNEEFMRLDKFVVYYQLQAYKMMVNCMECGGGSWKMLLKVMKKRLKMMI
jgi:hypothetical protein